MNRDIELYQKLYGEKINPLVKDKISDEGATSRAAKFRICKEAVNRLWEEDKEKPDVMEAINEAKARQLDEKKAQDQTPERYNK
jgi:hypothetical protein